MKIIVLALLAVVLGYRHKHRHSLGVAVIKQQLKKVSKLAHHLRNKLAHRIVGDSSSSLAELKSSAKDRAYLSSQAVDYSPQQLDKNQETRQALHSEAVSVQRQHEMQTQTPFYSQIGTDKKVPENHIVTATIIEPVVDKYQPVQIVSKENEDKERNSRF